MSTVRDEDGVLRPLRVEWSSREPANRGMYCCYKCMRTFYVSVYFYFMPFTTIMLTCIIPIISSFSQVQ